MSQAEVAEKMNTSQSAVARIEGAEENITLSTLQRLIVALKGRLQISIGPEEMRLARRRPWWEICELSTSNKGWSFVGGAYRQVGTTEQVILGFQKENGKKFLLTEGTTT
jgi:transcriptional regulator with XRE-family HTH domain